jgi:hypothetical protein
MKEKLYRKINKKSLSTKYYVKKGGEYSWKRSKVNCDLEYPMFESMKSKKLGRDYTPLYRFLESKIDQVWNDIYSECVKRLDTTDPIWWVVVNSDLSIIKHNYNNIVRIGQGSYCQRLYINKDGILKSL